MSYSKVRALSQSSRIEAIRNFYLLEGIHFSPAYSDLLRSQNQISGHEPRIVRGARARIENVVSMAWPVYERCTGVRPTIYSHDAATAINEKNNRSFATPNAALLVSGVRVSCRVLRRPCICDQWKLRVRSVIQSGHVQIGALALAKCLDPFDGAR